MSPMGDILLGTERQVRELSRCETAAQATQVWQQVVESADDPFSLPATVPALMTGMTNAV